MLITKIFLLLGILILIEYIRREIKKKNSIKKDVLVENDLFKTSSNNLKLIPTDKITLENVKKSDYWELIAIMVWNHYREEKFQDESMIEISEQWYGWAENSSSHNRDWNNPNYSEEGYERKLNNIQIYMERSDYITYIFINLDGSVDIYGKRINDTKSVYYYPNYLNVINWMLDHDFITINK